MSKFDEKIIMLREINVHKYLQKTTTNSFHCRRYLKISPGSVMVKCDKAFKENVYTVTGAENV